MTPNSGDYEQGTNVTISAVPAEGYIFNHWEGDVDPMYGLNSSITINMDSEKNITAMFSQVPDQAIPGGGNSGFN